MAMDERKRTRTWAGLGTMMVAILGVACGPLPPITPISLLPLSPDAAGNIKTLWGGRNATVYAGTRVSFTGLGPLDDVIEVGSPSLTSDQLCNATDLGPGNAHAVVAQNPIPASPYAANELSGPYHTYPAGLYSLSPSNDACQYLEKIVPCTPPNEDDVASQGTTDYLCSVTRYLMDPTDPSHILSPPTINPACVLGRSLDSTWSDPAIQGVFLRLDWNAMNPSYGSYDWSLLDGELTKAVKNGKTVTVGIRVGGNSIPGWAFSTGDPTLGPVKKVELRDWGTGGDSIPNGSCGFKYAVASPSDLAFKALFKKALADMAAHIREDQRRFSVLAGVKVTGLGMATLENRLPSRCNVAVADATLGDTGTQGHIVSMASTDLTTGVVFDARYRDVADPAFGRIEDVSKCVCNPQVLQNAGYKPSVLQAFYSEIETTIHDSFGYKQQVYMSISAGFPQIGETGRFLGDHLVPPITSAFGVTPVTYGAVYGSAAGVPIDVPGANDTTKAVVVDARNGVFAGGDLTVARSFGVENAALDVIGFSKVPGVNCTQQTSIDVSTGSALFPIASTANVDSTGVACPNWLATKEGIAYDKAGGFQVVHLTGAVEIDAALWNLTLNTNGLFFEYYEEDAWLTHKQAALNAGGVLNPSPAVVSDPGTTNHASATAKSVADWNALLLERARSFSADPHHANLYQANPFPTSYDVTIVSAPGTHRYFFNARACKAYYNSGTPVVINDLTIAN
jgi:hypothetical protein